MTGPATAESPDGLLGGVESQNFGTFQRDHSGAAMPTRRQFAAPRRSWFPSIEVEPPTRDPRDVQEATQPPRLHPAPRLPIDAQYKVRRGDTIKKVLTRHGVAPQEAEYAIHALSKVFNPRRLKPGVEIFLQLQPPAKKGERRTLLSIDFVANPELDVSVLRNGNGKFHAETYKRVLTPLLAYTKAAIKSSLYEAGLDAKVPHAVLADMVNLYSFEVDFQRDVHPGDAFEVTFQHMMDESGDPVRAGDIIVASMTLSGKTRTLYRFKTKTGEADYYDEKGESAKRRLLRTPTDAVRISSRFGRRKHPILGYTRMHRGIDFAAPAGTPIYAAGNGRIEKIGWAGAYGKYIRIRHNGSFKTAYAHMRRFARGLKVGSRVKQRQIIGYVGSTGRSTGPHLHYEVIRDGKQINPQKLKLAAGHRLRGAELRRFKQTVVTLKQKVATLREQQELQTTLDSQGMRCVPYDDLC
ncbi:MAG: M23 family metallopeptidase [Alphaproteobacteria bacterium]|nr:M23 family metallopeptidase [Alphaproteobacteria bacterium]